MFAASSKTVKSVDRAYLTKFLDVFLDCLEKHKPEKLPLSSSCKYTENEIEIKPEEGVWKILERITYRMEICDPKTSNVAAEVIFKENGNDRLAMLFLRLKIEDDLISEIETLVTTEDNVKTAPVPFKPETQPSLSSNFKRSIRPAERDSRFTLMAVADGYWRAMETEGTADYRKTALLPDTERWENGMHTTNELWPEPGPGDIVFTPVFPYPDKNPRTAMQDFDHGIWYGTRVYDRRYPVIDEERGIILSMARFGSFSEDLSENPDIGPAPYVAEFFSVTDGKIREVHVVISAIKPSIKTKWPCVSEFQ